MTENKFLKDFPILFRKVDGKNFSYLDNSATTQKPESVVRAICGYYGGCNANPHRGVYELSVKATKIYEDTREKVKRFINAKSAAEIIFTKNATESLNLIAQSYGLQNRSRKIRLSAERCRTGECRSKRRRPARN